MSETTQREAAAGPAARLGAELRARRQSLGWELPDLAQSLRIRQTYLEAIEAGRMSELPGTTYALGFVRAYASALGLPGEQVASRFRAESGDANVKPALSFPAPVPQRGVPAGALMLLGLVILAGAYGGWYYASEHQRTPAETVPPIPDRLVPQSDKPAPSPQVASILPSAAAPAPVPPAPATQAGAPPQAANPAASAAAPPVPAGGPAGMTNPPAGSRPPAPAGNPLPAVQTPAPPGAVATPASQLQSTPATPAVAGQPAANQAATGQAGTGQAATAQAAPAEPAAAPPPPGTPAGTRIILRTTANAWVTVKQPSGPPLLNRLMHAGDTWPVPAGKPGLLMTTGNAGGTELDVDGIAIPTLGGSGGVRRDLKLDADALKAGPLPALPKPRPKPAAAPQDDGSAG